MISGLKVEDVLDKLSSLLSELKPNPSLLVSFWPQRGWLSVEEGIGRNVSEELSNAMRLNDAYLGHLMRLESLVPGSGGELVEIRRRYVTRTRLIVGAGPSAWEFSLLQILKPFGVPWIPGSTLKGVMRHVASLQLLERDAKLGYLLGFVKREGEEAPRTYEEMSLEQISEHLEKIGVSDEVSSEFMRFARLFGTKYYRGKLIVVGGFPVGSRDGRVITPEVISPHYKEYYEGRREIPSETLSPVPIVFPVIKEGVTFEFLIHSPKGDEGYVSELLDETLTHHGVGGKQTSGFGLFECVKGSGDSAGSQKRLSK